MKFITTLFLSLLITQPALASGLLDGLWEGKFVCKGFAQDGEKLTARSKTVLDGAPSRMQISLNETVVGPRSLSWNVDYDDGLYAGVNTSVASKVNKGKLSLVACGSNDNPFEFQDLEIGRFSVCDSAKDPMCVKGKLKIKGAFTQGVSGAIFKCKGKYSRVARDVDLEVAACRR